MVTTVVKGNSGPHLTVALCWLPVTELVPPGLEVWGISQALWPGSWCHGPNCLARGYRGLFLASMHMVLSEQPVLSYPHSFAYSLPAPGFPGDDLSLFGKPMPCPTQGPIAGPGSLAGPCSPGFWPLGQSLNMLVDKTLPVVG